MSFARIAVKSTTASHPSTPFWEFLKDPVALMADYGEMLAPFYSLLGVSYGEMLTDSLTAVGVIPFLLPFGEFLVRVLFEIFLSFV